MHKVFISNGPLNIERTVSGVLYPVVSGFIVNRYAKQMRCSITKTKEN